MGNIWQKRHNENELIRKCKCSHTIQFTVQIPKRICSHCGSVVYIDDRAKFKGELGKAMQKKFV